jgi:hypothetical protein
MLASEYNLCESPTNRTDAIKDGGAFLDSNFIYKNSQAT